MHRLLLPIVATLIFAGCGSDDVVCKSGGVPLGLGGIAGMRCLGGGGEESGESDCYRYCDKLSECVGEIDDEAYAMCKSDCDQAETESGFPFDQAILDCASEESCDDFLNCFIENSSTDGDDSDTF
ncbi:MAG: hypothetical protein C4523_01775 [Myxococcales bacterium]|nr:MAG: hypothetical protein C4523_01775 [Myxococcales bacterium]